MNVIFKFNFHTYFDFFNYFSALTSSAINCTLLFWFKFILILTHRRNLYYSSTDSNFCFILLHVFNKV